MRDTLIQFAKQLEAEDNIAFDLWSWLPSKKAAEAAHGDYYHEHRPSLHDLMHETITYICFLRGREISSAEVEQWFGCPCGDCEHSTGKLPEPEEPEA